MIKNNMMRVMVIVSSILVIIGIVLMYQEVTHPTEENVIDVHIEEGSIETLEFAQLQLIPGSSADYLVRIHQDYSQQCELTMDFVEIQQGTLKNYAYVKIISGDKVLYDELLATAFEDDSLIVSVDFDKNHNTELIVEYYMPLEVGNEAKNAEALFELHISAYNEEVVYGE